MGMPGRAPLRTIVGRRVPRCPLAVPVRITVLHPGNAYSIPGRSLDLGEGGIAAVLAGELRAGDPVGIEFLLPDLGLGVQAKAVVRHRGALRCGFEFQQLTQHQQALLREWTRLMLGAEPRGEAPRQEAPKAGEAPVKATPKPTLSERLMAYRRFAWWAVAVFLLVVLAAWWSWERQWRELEQQIPSPDKAVGLTVLPQPKAEDLALNPSIWKQPAFYGSCAG
jgi:PilZ domain